MQLANLLHNVRKPMVAGLLILAIGIGLTSCILLSGSQKLPQGIISGNGRMEARQVDITARYPGQLLELRVQEGDAVKTGQILGVLDTRELNAALRAAEARIVRARQGRIMGGATIAKQQSSLRLATLEFGRAETLHHSGFAAQQFLDQKRNSRQEAASGLSAAQASLFAADADLRTAEAEADRIREQIADATLRAPKAGRVLYRLAEPGEQISAGGAIATLLDLSNVYMTVFLPTREAGALAIESPARIVLDASPDTVLPAYVSFVSPEAQFTPRQVETRNEREQMMYRVRVRLPDVLVKKNIEQIKTGVTGVAYIQVDPKAVWPSWLQSAPARKPSGQ